MRRAHLSPPSPAMVVALIALSVALGGASYAAITLPKNSVGAKQIKANAVNSAKVKNGSLLARDFKASERAGLVGPRGPAGAAGATGAAGAQGAAGAAGAQGPKGTVDIGAWHVVGAAGEVGFGATFANEVGAEGLRFRLEGDVVRMQGEVRSSQVAGTFNLLSPNVVFTLPVGFRPVATMYMPVVGQQTTGTALIQVSTSGDVRLLGSSNGFADFAGVTFAVTA